MSTLSFEITDGAVKVAVTVTEMEDGTLKFDLTVLGDTGTIGDLNGLFFDLADDSKTDLLTVSGTDLTGENIDANSVFKVDSYNNVNGEVVKEDGRFDVGVQFGTQGIATDDIRETSFTLGTSDGSPLTISDIFGQDFAVRLTSVGTEDGAREDSVKISGTSEGEIVDPDPDPEEPAVNEAAGDTMTATSSATFNEGPFTDPLDNFVFSILQNDTSDGTNPYTGSVTQLNGQDWVDGLVVNGSNGGQLLVYANGWVDFSANGDFDHLSTVQSEQTQFTYAIEGGSTATIDVTVYGDDGTGGGIDF